MQQKCFMYAYFKNEIEISNRNEEEYSIWSTQSQTRSLKFYPLLVVMSIADKSLLLYFTKSTESRRKKIVSRDVTPHGNMNYSFKYLRGGRLSFELQ